MLFNEKCDYLYICCRWDFYLKKGSVIESIDGQTDIIHKHLNGDWLPWYVVFLFVAFVFFFFLVIRVYM